LRGALLASTCSSLSILPASAQVAGANQNIYSDEQSLLRTDEAMANQYRREEQATEQELDAEQARTEPYRLYAEKRIAYLQKAKKAGTPIKTGDKTPELVVLQRWLQQDEDYREKQQAYIAQLDESIRNLRQGESQTLANLGTDINSMRESVQDQKDQQKFQNQMSINMYNELKSEMGAAAWGDCPADGTLNSTGGYGMMGGYGYSPMGWSPLAWRRRVAGSAPRVR
jgi:actin-related protein